MRLHFLSLSLITGLSAAFVSCRQTTPMASSSTNAASAPSAAAPAAPHDGLGALSTQQPAPESQTFTCGKDSPPLVMYHPERQTLQYCQAGVWVELPNNALLSDHPAKPHKKHVNKSKVKAGAAGQQANQKNKKKKKRKGDSQPTLAYYHGETKAQKTATKNPTSNEKTKSSTSFYCRPGTGADATYHCMRSLPKVSPLPKP